MPSRSRVEHQLLVERLSEVIESVQAERGTRESEGRIACIGDHSRNMLLSAYSSV